jgi:hypothetical protein
MSLSLFDVSVPVFLRGFANLTEILKKAEAFADEKGISHEDLLNARLIDDMYPLIGQVQRASDAAKFVAVRLGQVENLPMEDNETSFADLHARIAKTVDFLKAVPASAFEGREEAEVVLKTRGGETTYTGRDYLLGFAIPNFYFHLSMAYAIVRHKGVPVGKMDYIGRS